MDSLGFYFSRTFVKFSSKRVYPNMAGVDFQIYVVQITGKCICEPKNDSSHFCSCLQGKTLLQVLIATTQTEGNYSEEAKKVTKIELVRLVTSFDKSHHLCTLHIFACSFALP